MSKFNSILSDVNNEHSVSHVLHRKINKARAQIDTKISINSA